MKVKSIRRPKPHQFQFELEDGQGTLLVSFLDQEVMVCGTWSSAHDDSFMAMNNLDNFGNGPGIEKELSIKNPGEAAEWFWQETLKWKRQIADQEREEREQRRKRRIESQKGLKGGLEV